jgi:hypothetical protein
MRRPRAAPGNQRRPGRQLLTVSKHVVCQLAAFDAAQQQLAAGAMLFKEAKTMMLIL